jgi:hypothetical protein
VGRGTPILLPLVLACTADAPGEPVLEKPRSAARFALDVQAQRAGDLWAGPVPGPGVLDEDGVVSIAGFPNPDGTGFVAQVVALLDGRAVGAGRTSGVFFPVSGALDPSTLPSLVESIDRDASVRLVNVDADSPGFGERVPVDVVFQADPGPHGPVQGLALLPLQGVPLRPDTRYAAVVTTAVRGEDGWLPGLDGCPDGFSEALCSALETEVHWDRVAAVTAFRTGHPEQDVARWAAHARATAPAEPPASLELVEVFDDFCV